MTPRRRALLFGLVVAAAAVVPYLNSLAGGFVYDDRQLVIGNPRLTDATTVRDLFVHESAREMYRPLTMLTYLANRRLAPGPFGYHLLNLVLHALASVAAFALARTILPSPRAALAAALAFALHPVHTEVVANIAGRAEILAALFVLLTLLAADRAARVGSRPWRALSLVCFAAALLSKESAVTALALVPLLTRWRSPSLPRQALARELVPYGVVAAAFIAARMGVLGAFTMAGQWPFIDNPLREAGFWEREATALVVLLDYLSMLTLPLTLSPDYTFDQVPVVRSWLDPRLLVAVGGLGGLALIVLALRRREAVLPFAAAFFALSLAVTANVLFPIGVTKAERLLYLPSFGWCLASGWLAARWSHDFRDRRRLVAVSLLAIALGVRAWSYSAEWRDEATLFAAAVRSSPNSARAHSNLAAILGRARRLEPAIEHYRRALAIYPRYAVAARGLAQALALSGQTEEARHWYTEAKRLAGDHVAAR